MGAVTTGSLEDIKARNEAMIEEAQTSAFDTIVGDAGAVEAVTRKAPKSGGYYSIGRKDYWIPEPLYTEVEDKDKATPMGHKGTKEFGKWLKAFLKEHDIKPDVKKNTRSLSGYWAMPYTYDVKASDPLTGRTVKMASVLRAMRSVVSVVDPEHKCTVEYNPQSRTSAWDTQSRVFLPVEPIDRVTDLEDCINVMGGFAIHEAWHSTETRNVLGPAGLDFIKDQWNAWIMNLIEDVRIEDRGLHDTPGYAEYLNYTQEYMWSEKGLPTEWPTKPEQRFNVAISLIRYADRIDEILTDPSFVEPREWLRDWVKRYCEAPVSTKTMIDFVNEGRAFFEITDETPPPQPSSMMMACAKGATDKGLNEAGAEGVAKAIEEETETAAAGSKPWAKIFGDDPSKMAGYGARMKSVVIRRPRPSGKYKASRGDLIEKAKAALTLRKTEPQNDTRMMKSGVLDEDELYRFSTGDTRIFKDATIESLPSAAVYLLVDMSGSMGRATDAGRSAYYAVKMAQLLVEGLSKNQHVKLKVLGHTGENRDNYDGGSFYRIWEPGDSMDRLSILADNSLYSENYDGWAILWAGNMLKEEQAEQKLLIVLADGIPSASGYGGTEGMDHVRNVTDKLLRQGVSTVQVAVSPWLSEESQKRMFKHYIAVQTSGGGEAMFSVILRKLTKVLTRVV